LGITTFDESMDKSVVESSLIELITLAHHPLIGELRSQQRR
jgi:hypothetical protein